MERSEQPAFICTGRTIPDGGDVSSARRVKEDRAVEKSVPTTARQVCEQSSLKFRAPKDKNAHDFQ